jgi:hypothetical protein
MTCISRLASIAKTQWFRMTGLIADAPTIV